jgi:mono/diheme cytochrome c family protein
MRLALAIPLAAGLLGAVAAVAAPYERPPETAALKPGPGVELANQHCRACHSVDYITTQPPGVAAGFWQAEVTKMVNVFGARIPAADAGKIVDYLNATYRAPA